MPSKTLILDPLTLRGREFLRCSEPLDGIVGEWDFRHTDLDDEHQIADMTEGPALVPPLEGPDDFAGPDVIVVASDGWSSRHEHLIAYLDNNPETILLDLTGSRKPPRSHNTFDRGCRARFATASSRPPRTLRDIAGGRGPVPPRCTPRFAGGCRPGIGVRP